MKTVSQAVILAAGESSRFYPYNKLGHKCLVTLGGQTLIKRTLLALKKKHITNIVIIEGVDEPVSKSLSKDDLEGLSVTFLIQEKATGMGEALILATKYLADSFFLLSGYHFDAGEFITDLVSAKKKATDVVLLTSPTPESSNFGVVKKVNGKVTISEKGESGPGEKVIGIYLLPREFVYHLHEEKKEHYSFEAGLSSYSHKNTIVVVQTKKKTLSLKYPWDLLDTKDYILRGVRGHVARSAKISRHAVFVGKSIFIDEGVTVMDGAVVGGPCYIGKQAYVGTNAVIRGGVLVEEGAVVGAQMEVKNSILMREATTHSGFVGDSIVGEKTKIAAGFHTANVRLDRGEISARVKQEKVSTGRKYFGAIVGSGDNIGIKVGTMPGVIIGNDVVIGPSTTVMENIEDSVTYYTEFKGIVKKKNSV